MLSMLMNQRRASDEMKQQPKLHVRQKPQLSTKLYKNKTKDTSFTAAPFACMSSNFTPLTSTDACLHTHTYRQTHSHRNTGARSHLRTIEVFFLESFILRRHQEMATNFPSIAFSQRLVFLRSFVLFFSFFFLIFLHVQNAILIAFEDPGLGKTNHLFHYTILS